MSTYHKNGRSLYDDRILWNLSHLDIAQADGQWSQQDVADVESEPVVDPERLRRYLNALYSLTGMEL